MPRVGQHIVARSDRMHARRCLSCGYAGPELQGDRGKLAFRCPACAEDLYSRPAMSYSEMEGFDDLERSLSRRRLSRRDRLNAWVDRALAATRGPTFEAMGRAVVIVSTLGLLALVIVLAGEFAAVR